MFGERICVSEGGVLLHAVCNDYIFMYIEHPPLLGVLEVERNGL